MTKLNEKRISILKAVSAFEDLGASYSVLFDTLKSFGFFICSKDSSIHIDLINRRIKTIDCTFKDVECVVFESDEL